MKTALIFPPQWFPSQPYLALPTLSAFLQDRGHEADQFDFNIESYDIFLSRDYLEECLDKIRHRLDRPAYSPEDNEIKNVYREILGDTEFVESILNGVGDAKQALRTEELFFQFPVYKRAYTTLKVAMQLISYAHFPSRIDLESFFMRGNPEENLQGILQATADPIANPYLTLFESRLLDRVPWNEYGLAGISIIHVGQVIAGLTLARLLRERFPHLHIVIGGSVFTRHNNTLENKQVLFEKMFHSII
ncbi:MAG: radical SAM protein, partial [Nitrospinaceae bacterium]|nr:radical SAM protein [Nitrospinaceae bacterium]NIR57074.1 radical SAM protein [Nitrospinaceae bacterium]NIS87515.1 radical SAM protein [Nitrospinaceae bacterium]NIT84385.1 radical SAM protein [Nitrospinaceae bacterium]NIU46572.1 radical SAM protein [Nitrospinaceae bacterium]